MDKYLKCHNKVYKRMDSFIFDVPNIVMVYTSQNTQVFTICNAACVCMLDDAPVIVNERLEKSLVEVSQT